MVREKWFCHLCFVSLIGQRKEIQKVTFRALPVRQSESPTRFSFTLFVFVCTLVQVILDVVKTQTPVPFVVLWITRYIPDIDKWRAFIPDTQHSPNQAAVNELLTQFFSNSAFPARYQVKLICMIHNWLPPTKISY